MVMTPSANPLKSADHRVERAGEGDIHVLSLVIADAFHGLDVSQWLVPDPDARRGIFPPYFRSYVEHAMADGLVYTTPARDAVALWLPVGPEGPGAPPDGYAERLADVTGPHLDRFQALDEGFDTHHPAGAAHQYLAIIAVRPDRQRLGIGTAMLRARHAVLDRDGIPAYLEASDTDKREIYRKHGYVLRPDAPIRLPGGGPELWPMWREPQRTARRRPRM
jgi:GNAT superfamily N-acetyltransferase